LATTSLSTWPSTLLLTPNSSHFIADEVAVDGDEDDDEDGDEDGEEDDDDNGSMAGFIDDRGEDELSVSGDEVDA